MRTKPWLTAHHWQRHPRPGLGVAQQALEGELRTLRAPHADLLSALEAAEELLPYPRARWATPVDDWERTVIALAVCTLRVEGALRKPRAVAVAAVREAIGTRKGSAA